ncbi:MAG: DUF1957 domain-containing protein [Spirochaetaceae bacterium]|nr:DUF1957 domain-containing protein [Spirochaetaceae bacterium]
MANKTISIFINAHQSYLEKSGLRAEKTSFFYEMAETYIPILRFLDRVEEKKISSKLTFALTPSLCALFSHEGIQNEFCQYLNDRIELAKKMLGKNPEKTAILEKFIEKNLGLLEDFSNRYEKNLTDRFFRHYKSGHIDLATTTATPLFIPFFDAFPSVVDAQFEAGITAFREFFEVTNGGFLIPHQFYSPETERLIQLFGFKWICVDKSAFLGGNPTPSKGIFAPVVCPHGTIAVASDSRAEEDFFNKGGYATDGAFLDVENDDSLFQRTGDSSEDWGKIPLGLCFTAKNGGVYDWEKAEEKAKMYAGEFWANCKNKLSSAAKIAKDDVNLTFFFNASTFGHTWSEGMVFLEELLRLAGDSAIFTKDVAENYSPQEAFAPAVSTNRKSFAEDFLDKTNSWALRYVQKSAERMIELSKRFSHDSILKERILSVAARQVLLMEDAYLLEMIKNENFAEETGNTLKELISNFSFLFDSLGSNKMNTEWLIRWESSQRVFSNLNYRIFTPKI